MFENLNLATPTIQSFHHKQYSMLQIYCMVVPCKDDKQYTSNYTQTAVDNFHYPIANKFYSKFFADVKDYTVATLLYWTKFYPANKYYNTNTCSWAW